MSENKEFDAIMREITSGLTGDSEKDIKYLDEQCQKYKTHPMAMEILRACGRMVASLMPEDLMAEFAKLHGNEMKGTEAALDEAKYNLYQKNYDKALEIMEGLVNSVEKQGWFNDDAVSEYHCFNEFFEEALYRMLYEPKKDLRQAEIPYLDIYLYYGIVLIDKERIVDAIEAFKKGLKWNPICFTLNSEYREALKMSGRMDEFFSETIKAFKIAFRPKDLGKCYRDLGFYFIEKKQYSEAMGCYAISTSFDKDSKQAMSEMYYIQGETGGKVKEPSIEELKAYAEKYGFPVGADNDVVGLAIGYGKHFLDNGESEGAKYVFQIAYDLTDNEEIKRILDTIEKA
jgi:tetratricopeptide (TPR) repeat protein